MKDTINIHAQFSGIVAQTLDEIIRSGRAASRTEAIRLAILDYREHHLESNDDEIRGFISGSNKDIFEDKEEDKVWAKYLKGDKK